MKVFCVCTFFSPFPSELPFTGGNWGLPELGTEFDSDLAQTEVNKNCTLWY